MTSPGKDFAEVADRVWVHRKARLEVESFFAGPGTVVNAYARIFGTRVTVGREGWFDEHATVGGGSAHDPGAFLAAGHWLHLGNYSQVNTARGATIGDEVGIGIGSRVFTHGAYLSEWDGYPVDFQGVTIGSRVWLPSAQVNPGVRIGDDVVVAAGSVVTRDIPSGSFAAGVPAVVKGPAARDVPQERRAAVLETLCAEIESIAGKRPEADPVAGTLRAGDALFDLDKRAVTGEASPLSESARNQLRRRGIRFPVEVHEGAYRRWPELDGGAAQ